MLRKNIQKDKFYDVKIYIDKRDYCYDYLLDDVLVGPMNISSQSYDNWTIVRGFIKGTVFNWLVSMMSASPYSVGYEKVLVREGHNKSWEELMW